MDDIPGEDNQDMAAQVVLSLVRKLLIDSKLIFRFFFLFFMHEIFKSYKLTQNWILIVILFFGGLFKKYACF